MQKRINIATIFPKYLFCDVKMDELDVENDKDNIIPRGLFVTSPETFETDIKKLENLYSKTAILDEFRTTEERISNEVANQFQKGIMQKPSTVGAMEVVSSELFRKSQEIQNLPSFHDLYLGGGTNLAMHYGHWKSDDIDLFSPGINRVEFYQTKRND